MGNDLIQAAGRGFNMARASTVRDIAIHAGCAPTTVSRYLNRSGYVSAETAARIDRAIEHLDYTPNQIARSLKQQKNDTILLIVPNITNPFYAAFYRVVQALATSRGFIVTLYDTNEKREEELKAIRVAMESNMRGISFTSIDPDVNVISRLVRSGIPAVVNFYGKSPFDSVHGKRNDSAHIAVRHLIDYGHHRIGFAGGAPGTMVGLSRRRGYLNALQENGLPVLESLMVEFGFTLDSGRQAGEYFMALTERPTAICCANDLIAFGLMTYLNEQGVAIPDEVSVTGIDDIMYAQAASPPLTTVSSDPERFAEETVRLLFGRIDGTLQGEPRNAIIQHRLVLRRSTRPIG